MASYNVVLLLSGVLVGVCQGANILALCGMPAYSHHLPLQAIIKILAGQGHNITLISTYPPKEKLENVIHLSLPMNKNESQEIMNYNAKRSNFDVLSEVMLLVGALCDSHLGSETMQKFMREKPHFDVVIHNLFLFDCYLGLVHHLGSPPVIGYLPFTSVSPILDIMGSPVLPAVSPNHMSTYTNQMTLLERIDNWLANQKLKNLFHHHHFSNQNSIMRRWFGPDTPTAEELLSNVNVLFITNFWALNYPHPYFPNVVEMAGLHINEKPSKLPQDVQAFMDGAEHGVVYINFGSIVQVSRLPPAVFRDFKATLSALPQRVLCKWEADTLEDPPSNMMTKPWLPQEAVLAHRNIRLFITHGGLQSFQEATYYGVPLIVIPFAADQPHNAAKIVDAGVGRMVPNNQMTKERLTESITDVLTNDSYRRNMQSLKEIFRDYRSKSKHDVVWWTDFVIKHKGIPQIRPSSQKLSWYQLQMLDAVFLVSFALVILGVILLWLTRKVFSNLHTKQKIQ